jgi:hypothetical protein
MMNLNSYMMNKKMNSYIMNMNIDMNKDMHEHVHVQFSWSQAIDICT